MHGEYVEVRDQGYYVAGTRISLDSVVYSFNEGNSPEAIQQDFPLLERAAHEAGSIVLTWAATTTQTGPAKSTIYLHSARHLFTR